jgi:hypothetical protein
MLRDDNMFSGDFDFGNDDGECDSDVGAAMHDIAHSNFDDLPDEDLTGSVAALSETTGQPRSLHTGATAEQPILLNEFDDVSTESSTEEEEEEEEELGEQDETDFEDLTETESDQEDHILKLQSKLGQLKRD